MNLGGVVTIATAVVGLAVVAVAVTSPYFSGIITAVGTAFSNALKAATGK